ncbi:hypothetical protein AX14_014235 [Amanita brunnescens Koide BX004]|nr:hypothetical protein AX14_014235 [Amanita brunnescens Koide BX004]
MLGNSIRGIGPRQRSLAFQSCVLPVLSYGLALWYAPGGSGVIKHVRRMERVHTFAMSWITGTFCTTPSGAKSVIAGIPPLRILLDMRFHGLQARLTTLDDYHIAHTTWSLRWTHPRLRSIKPKSRPCHLPSDNPLDRLATDEVKEQFLPFHATSRPGERLLDLFAYRITINASSPKKGSSLFKAWLRDLSGFISALHSSGQHVIYTDGAFWNKSSRGSYSFTVFHNGLWSDFSGWCPAGSSFDAEIVALEEAVQWACVQKIDKPVFFVDNKAVLSSFLDTQVRPSQMATVRINEILCDRLTTSTASFSFRYCPSHSGINGNERADRLTKNGAALAPMSPPVFFCLILSMVTPNE